MAHRKRRNHTNNILIALMFSGDLVGRGSPVLLFCTEPVSLNAEIHKRINFGAETEPTVAILNRFLNGRWVETTERPLKKYASTANAHCLLF